MIQSILDSIPIYLLSLFCMPKNVANLVKKKIRDFLWEGFDGADSSHSVSWEVVTKPKEEEGLGIRNLSFRNKALLGKCWWRFHSDRNSLCAEVIESKYGLQENGWDLGCWASLTNYIWMPLEIHF